MNGERVRLEVALAKGPAPISAQVSEAPGAWATLALAHGAGAGMDHPFLQGAAERFAAAGIRVVRFSFPYAEAGRRMPGPVPHAIATWQRVAAFVTGEFASAADAATPWIAAGKSYGGRMASMAVAEGVLAPSALVYLGYPLHPPGQPEKLRSAHLSAISRPQLFVAGTADPFLQPLSAFEAVVDGCVDADIEWVTGGGHSFERKGERAPADEVGARVADRVTGWLETRFQRPAA